jgi:ubiquinone biosynthesis protein COQ9
MIAPPERSPERDAAIDALLPNVPFDGWTMSALKRAAGPDADLLFPGGAPDMIEAWCDLADRRMEEEAARQGVSGRLPDRVRAVIALRLAQNRPYREAVRRALSILSLPRHAGLAARCTARTVDAIWHAAGDRSADFSWYTKRAILASVYTGTVLYWLTDTSEDDAATLAFLDRRLAGVGRIGRMRKRVEGIFRRGRPSAAA